MAKLKELINIVGKENYAEDEAELISYSRDAFPGEWHMPEVVVRPETTEQVSRIMKFASKNKIPLTPRGAGTSLAANSVPVKGGILLDLQKMNKILEISPKDLQVVVQPGVVYDDLNLALKKYNLFFPPDPGSASVCTIGGMVANNASGMRAVKYGVTRDYVLKLEVVLPDGTVIKTGSNALKSSSGYDLVRLFVGSEGTLGVFTEITLRLRTLPKYITTALALFSRVDAAASAVSNIIGSGLVPGAIELLDKETIKAVGLEEVGAMLLFELHGSKNAVQEDAQKLSKICIENGCIEIKVAKNEKEREELWLARRGAYPALVRIKPSPITGDVGVPISKYPDLIKKTQIVAKKYGIRLANFGHSGDGNLHFIIIADQRKSKEWERAQKVNREIIKYALEFGGTCTCEHGVGLEKKEFMRLEHGNTLDIMLALKKTLDPNNIMNPSKIFEMC